MNALASDQAGRIAKIIWNNSKLKGHITAGLFVGQSEHDPRMVMGPDGIITNKKTQRLNPPDILLTNYKMLDYLLVRPKDFKLWQHNGPETLSFLVVDELHTFDGAQGTDLACLVRRLKARLSTPQEYLCCVGTSATLGSEREVDTLREYAQIVFGEPFDQEAIILESQMSAGEFLEQSLISHVGTVPPEKAKALEPQVYNGYQGYIPAQYKLWFEEDIPKENFEKNEWRVVLAGRLKEHLFFQNLLKILGGKIRSYDEIFNKLEKVTPELRNAELNYRENLLNSLLALVSEARLWIPKDPEDQLPGQEDRPPLEVEKNEQAISPFLNIRVHYWLRELRRMVGEVLPQPRLRFADDLNEEQLKVHLPLVHCRECGSMGWAGLKRRQDSAIIADLQAFYIGFFNYDPKVVFLFPEEKDSRESPHKCDIYHLCTDCLNLTTSLHPDICPSCGHKVLVRVFMPDTKVRRKKRIIGLHDCPYCEAPAGLTLLGSRAASLTSVLLAQSYSSYFNNDKKLLTFSDSVQDAAHRAGFFGARTYRFNFRSALQQFVLKQGAGISLTELPKAFISHWAERMEEDTYMACYKLKGTFG